MILDPEAANAPVDLNKVIGKGTPDLMVAYLYSLIKIMNDATIAQSSTGGSDKPELIPEFTEQDYVHGMSDISKILDPETANAPVDA